ncbi:MAG: hypothetical protein AB7D42_02480 [Candidatus Methanomethylophilaceae archaeon]|nr:hypothetical protein [Candidatus Methanomethylophilaceae archaeon]
MNDDNCDPNAGLFGNDAEESEEEMLAKQLFGKNPNRVSALRDLIFEDMMESIDTEKMPEDAKRELIFKMAINSVLDMVMEATPDEISEEMTYAFDSYIGVALTNRKYGVDLFKEQSKALLSIDPKQFEDDEQYEAALREFEEQWWSISQPLLGQRNPNDAIAESMKRYGLLE